MKFRFIYLWLHILACSSPKENKPIVVNVQLSVVNATLPADIERLTFGSVSLRYALEWELKNEEKYYGTNNSMRAGKLMNATFLFDSIYTEEDLKEVGRQTIWKDTSSCQCDRKRPDGAIIISKPKIELCNPILLSKEGKNFEGAYSSYPCISLELDDLNPTQIYDLSTLSSEILLDFSESAGETGLCFKNNIEFICLNSFNGSVSSIVQ